MIANACTRAVEKEGIRKKKEKKKRGEGCELPEENKSYPRKTRATEDQNQAQRSIIPCPQSTADVPKDEDVHC